MYKTLDVVSQLPTATGDLAAFLTSGLLPSIANVQGCVAEFSTKN